MKFSLVVSPDLSEELNYNIEGLPVFLRREELIESEHMSLCHWHPDLEFIKIDRGTMYYFVNGEIIRLEEGHGLFVNSGRLHYGFSPGKIDCEYCIMIVHTDLFAKNCRSIDDYLMAKFGLNNEDYICLSPDIPWQNRILEGISETEKEIKEGDPLSLVSRIAMICSGIGKHIQVVRDQHMDNKHYQEFLLMTNYIRNHFSEKMTIDDMASSGRVCRSLCCSLFQEFASQTPTQYLTKYRLLRSCQALRETQLSVTEISGLCGFQTPSYYASVFKKNLGMTPQEFRLWKKPENRKDIFAKPREIV
ncbi:MAG: AraC family transcriptional regulator [Clostridiales bacterium]|nr:AraC family transcriptional regulator [Clostridiales bacterium]